MRQPLARATPRRAGAEAADDVGVRGEGALDMDLGGGVGLGDFVTLYCCSPLSNQIRSHIW